MTRVFGFQKQLRIGEAGEASLKKVYHREVVTYVGREWDFIDNHGMRIEVKTDSRSLLDTPNVFIERWSSMGPPKKPGGPWQAAQHGVHHFVIWFPKDGVYFVFTNVLHLCRLVQKWATHTGTELKVIRNRGWEGAGWIIPRADLLDICGDMAEVYQVEKGIGVLKDV